MGRDVARDAADDRPCLGQPAAHHQRQRVRLQAARDARRRRVELVGARQQRQRRGRSQGDEVPVGRVRDHAGGARGIDALEAGRLGTSRSCASRSRPTQSRLWPRAICTSARSSGSLGEPERLLVQRERALRCAGEVGGGAGGEQAPRPLGGVGGQGRREVQESRLLRAVDALGGGGRGGLELARERVVRTDGGLRPVPRATLQRARPRDGSGQRGVRAAALRRRRARHRGGPHERVGDGDAAGREVDERRRLQRLQHVAVDAERALRGGVLGGGRRVGEGEQEQRAAGVGGQCGDARAVSRSMPPATGSGSGSGSRPARRSAPRARASSVSASGLPPHTATMRRATWGAAPAPRAARARRRRPSPRSRRSGRPQPVQAVPSRPGADRIATGSPAGRRRANASTGADAAHRALRGRRPPRAPAARRRPARAPA